MAMAFQIQHKTEFVSVGGKKTQVTRGGQGPPLLYLHSAGGETEWTRFHDKLAENFTLYVPAHPGFALSEGLAEIDNIHDLAWHYVDLMDELGLEQAPLVGFSIGGWLGAELSILRPARVKKLVLVNAAGLHVEGAPMAELFIDDLDQLRKLLFYDGDSPLAAEAMPMSLEDPRILMHLRAREATARIGWNPYLHNPKLRQQLRRIECPVLVLWGRNDQLIPWAHGEVYAEQIPAARLSVLEECGHMLPFEKTESFVAQTTEFLQ